MNGHERMRALFERKSTDIIPHFEILFMIPEQAFGLSWPGYEEFCKASPKEQEALCVKHLHIWERIIETYHWDAVYIPYGLDSFYKGGFVRCARERFKDRAMVFDFNGDGTFWMPFGGDAMWDFSIRLAEGRKGLHEEAEKKLARSNELAKRQADAGAEFIIINSDYGFNDNPFISPQDFSELVTPYLARNVAYMHSLGLKVILHSDGDLRKILDQIVSTEVDGYQSIDPQGHMDIKAVKEQYGDRLILMGNVMTSMLQNADEEENIRNSVKYCCEHAKPGGGYIFSTSNCLFAGMPLESYHIMLDEFNQYRHY